jgi:hypothetical protein
MCTPPLLGSNDDNALIEAFRLGDQRAGNALFRKYESYLKRACRKFEREHDWLNAGDLDGAASEAFALALKNYDPARGPFRAYLPKYVSGELRGMLEDRMRNGITGTGTTRVGRWLSGAWAARKDLPLEQIAKRAKVTSVETARRDREDEIAIREGTVPLGEVEVDADGNSLADCAALAYYGEDLDLRRRLDSSVKAQRALGWKRYQRDLANGEACPGGIEPTDTRLPPWRIDGEPWPTRAGDVAIRANDYFDDLAQAAAAERAKGRPVRLTPAVIRAAHQSLARMEERQRQRRFLPGCGYLPDPNGWRKPHPSRVVQRKRPRLRLVINNAAMAQKGQKWNPQKKPYSAMASSLRLESTPAWREPWTPSHGGSC